MPNTSALEAMMSPPADRPMKKANVKMYIPHETTSRMPGRGKAVVQLVDPGGQAPGHEGDERDVPPPDRSVRTGRANRKCRVVVAMVASSALARHALGDREVVDVRVGAELRVELLGAAVVDELAHLRVGVVQVTEDPRAERAASTQNGSSPTSMRSTQKVHFSTTPFGRSGVNTRRSPVQYCLP